MSTLSNAFRMAVTAAWSAAFLSPRPIHRELARAAASVMRTRSSPTCRSIPNSARARDPELGRVHFLPVVRGLHPPVEPDATRGLGLGVDVFHVRPAADPVGEVRLLVHDERTGGAGELHLALRTRPHDGL